MTTSATVRLSVSALAATALFIVVVITAGGMVKATNASATSLAAASTSEPQPEPSMRLAALAELGITPEVLAVIDCDSTVAQGLATSCSTLMDRTWVTEYSRLNIVLGAARKAESDAMRKVNSAEDGVQAVATAKAAAADARDALDLHLNALESTLASALGSEGFADAKRIATKSRELGVDNAAMAGDFTEAQLVAYRSAVAAERIAAKRGESMSDEMAAALRLVRDDTAVLTARTRVQSRKATLDGILRGIGEDW